ncbi:hypothetical protein BDZ89DRAFT_1168140 [Hymenopellis radicata]|nr:hypothetical protein BDZ89DRAFT_1168140 [Hymenopellis radicata]
MSTAGYSTGLREQVVAYLIVLATSEPSSTVSLGVYTVAATSLLIVPKAWPGSVLSEARRAIDATREWLEGHARRRASASMYAICASGHFALDDILDRVHDLEGVHTRNLCLTRIHAYVRGVYALCVASRACLKDVKELKQKLDAEMRKLDQ